MRQHFEGGIYWDELAEICGEILRAAGFRGAARFRGNTVVFFCTIHCSSTAPIYTQYVLANQTWHESCLRDRHKWAKCSHWMYVYIEILFLNAICVYHTVDLCLSHLEPNHCCYRHSFAPCVLLLFFNVPVDIGALLAAVVVSASFSSWIYVCEPTWITFSFVTIHGSSYCTLDSVNILFAYNPFN